MMKRDETLFRTKVELPRWEEPMQVGAGSVFLGSCFAQQMGDRFLEYALPVLCNPLGVLYNPESIYLQVSQALSSNEVECPVFLADEEWRCWWASTLIAGDTQEACADAVQGALQMLGLALRQAQFLFVTLGTNVCYRLRSTGQVVANCHRMPQRLFAEERLTLTDCVQTLRRTVEEVRNVNPSCHIVFTVSPYRYAKYGFHGSQLAKSTLLLAVDEVCRFFPNGVSYFPAYEIVMDELRDYRFYDDDMIHPSPEAVNYIWTCLKESIMSPRLQQYLIDYEPIRRGLLHRPTTNDAPSHRAFLERLNKQKQQVMLKYNII